MKTKDKVLYLITPITIGLLLIISGSIFTFNKPEMPHGTIMTCSGLICIVLSSIMSLLMKLLGKD